MIVIPPRGQKLWLVWVYFVGTESKQLLSIHTTHGGAMKSLTRNRKHLTAEFSAAKYGQATWRRGGVNEWELARGNGLPPLLHLSLDWHRTLD